MGIPVPHGLTEEEIAAVDSFSMKVWGKPLFDRKPSHSGRHGWSCEFCAVELEKLRPKPAPAQPWNVVSIERRKLREAA